MDGRPSETVALLTSLPPEQLNAPRWLRLNRAHWGIETGLPARRDVSRRGDETRMRSRNAVWVANIQPLHFAGHWLASIICDTQHPVC